MFGFNDMSNLVGHFMLVSKRKGKEIEETIEEMNETDREE